MKEILTKSLGNDLEALGTVIADGWALPSPEIGFARHVFKTAQIDLPTIVRDRVVAAAEVSRLDQGPVLAAYGYELSLGTMSGDDSLVRSWADGFSRLASRNAFPPDRASFFYRPVELLGIALGAACCSKARPEDRNWLSGVLSRGQQKLKTSEPWGYYLSACAARALSQMWRSQTISPPKTLAAEELALLKWICIKDTPHAEELGVTAREAEITEALMRQVVVTSPSTQDAARAAVLYVALRISILQVLESAVEHDWQIGRGGRDAKTLIEVLCRRFHLAARQLLVRHSGRSTLTIGDEYDVQDLMHAMLSLHFEDVRAEEWTPSYGGSASRTDFLLKPEQIVIEVKMTRKNLDQKEVANQLIIDKERYKSHSDCKTLICFVYDPEGRCHNPVALEHDLSDESSSPQVLVIVAPKGA
jgi:hypothetical protein